MTLGILIGLTAESVSQPVVKDVLFKAHEWDLQARFTPIALAEYERWVAAHGQPRHIMTLIGRDLRAHRFWLDVKSHNRRALALYASEGFVEEGRRLADFSAASGRLEGISPKWDRVGLEAARIWKPMA